MNRIICFTFILGLIQSNVFGDELTRLTKRLMSSVVTIYTEAALGSGFIFDKEGYIFTNAHVISKLWDGTDDIEDPFTASREKITVILKNKHQYPAEVIGYDPRTDIGLLKIYPEEKLDVLKLGDSSKLKIGQKIIALGSPLGLQETATVGVISHVGRALSAGPGWEFPVNVIQTDAAINPGNSGGPMINLKGEVIGINYATTAKWASEGIGFAIPINVARHIKDRIISSDKVQYGERMHYSYLGAELYQISEEFAKAFGINKGILVETVHKNSPAERTGIEPGDIIVSLNKKEVSAVNEREVNDFQWYIATLPQDQEVNLGIIRQFPDGTQKEISFGLKLVESPLTEIELKPHVYSDFGFVIKEITEPVYLKYILSVHKGIWVSKVIGGPALEAGLRIGDVINKIDDNLITDSTNFEDNILDVLKKKKKYIPLEIYRKKEILPLFLPLTYQLEKKNVAIIVLSKKLSFELFNIIQMKLVFNGAGMTFAGLNKEKIPLIKDDTEKDYFIADIAIDSLKTNQYDAIVIVGESENIKEYTDKQKENIYRIIKEAVKTDKIIAVNGLYVVLLAESDPHLSKRRITCAQEYMDEIKKYNINPTGNEVEIDKKLVTSTGSKKSFKPFAYQLIKLLKE